MFGALFSRFASRMSSWAGQPFTFVLAVTIVALWGMSGPIFNWSDTWQLVINTGTTIVTFMMVFLIQNAQNRDASAMQVKLDEIIRAIENANNSYIGIEHLTDVQICKIRDALELDSGSANEQVGQRLKELSRLIQRR